MGTIELRRVDTRFEETYVYGVTEMPRAEHPNYYTIESDVVSVQLRRDADRAPWYVDSVWLGGRRILKNDSVGVKREQHYYTDRGVANDPHLPAWLAVLIKKVLKVAEADRLGGTPPCPKCGVPSILADPARPEEAGEYCEPCGWWFEVPLPWGEGWSHTDQPDTEEKRP